MMSDHWVRQREIRRLGERNSIARTYLAISRCTVRAALTGNRYPRLLGQDKHLLHEQVCSFKAHCERSEDDKLDKAVC